MKPPLSNIRILAILYGTELFGSERANLEALQSLQRSGAEIHLGVSSRVERGGDVGRRARELNFSTFEIPFGSHFARAWMANDKAYRNRQLKRIWSNSRIVSRKIKEIEPTHLMFSTVLSFMFTGMSTLLNRTPLIYRIGDSPVIESRFQMFFWRWLVRRSNHVVCVSDFIRNQVLTYSKKNKRKVTRIYNVPITRSGDADIALVRQLEKTKRMHQWVFVGQISPAKGIIPLIEAMIQLNCPNTGLWVVGGAGHNEDLLLELKERTQLSKSATEIVFFGYQTDPRAFYLCADWHVSPSTYEEPMANTTFEAKQAGIPSLVSNKGGFPEVIEHGQDGWILGNPDAETLLQAILEIHHMDSKWDEMGRRAKKSIARSFTHDGFDAQWTDIIQQTS